MVTYLRPPDMGPKVLSAVSSTSLIASRSRSQSFEFLHQRFMLDVLADDAGFRLLLVALLVSGMVGSEDDTL